MEIEFVPMPDEEHREDIIEFVTNIPKGQISEMQFGPVPISNEEHKKRISKCIKAIERQYIEKQFGSGSTPYEDHREANRENRKEKRNARVKKRLIIKLKRDGVKITVNMKVKN